MPSQGSLIDVDAELFQGVNHDHVAHLTRAFDIMAERLGGVSNSSALWALATLVAKILASTAMDPVLMETMGQRFSVMLRTAYPAMVRAMEEAQRQAEGRPAYDA